MPREELRLRPGDSNVDLSGRALVVDLEWDFAADLDLAALCVEKDGKVADLVCHGQEGRRTAAPYAHLGHSSEGDGRIKGRKEHLVITDADKHEVIYLFVWDHEANETGGPAAFAEEPSSFGISVTDRNNKRVKLETNPHKNSNTLLVGRIQRRSVRAIEGSRLGNVSDRDSTLREMIRAEVGGLT